MFTQAGRESSSKKQAERTGEEERYSITQHSLLRSRCSFKYFCVWFYLCFFVRSNGNLESEANSTKEKKHVGQGICN